LCQEEFDGRRIDDPDALGDQKMSFQLLERALRDLEELQVRTWILSSISFRPRSTAQRLRRDELET
jgi:hypothetical protein